jgi:flavin reductase (DIM6/NTAB) family NADH-FMN oxidoreductase RutF
MTDVDALVAAMDAAMVVVTAAAGDDRDGCLVGFHSQCSIQPPRYLVWLSRANRTFELAQRTDHLAVHVLAADDRELAELFGGASGDDVDKLAGCDWVPGPGGAPLLDDCPNRFVGRIVERIDGDGDHVGHVLEPFEASNTQPSRPLRYSAARDIDPGHDADERR